MQKKCTKCGEVKPLEKFKLDSRNKSGVAESCKDCVNAYHRKYYEENHDKHLARGRKYHAENRDKDLARGKKYKAENRAKELARAKKYYEENRAKELARVKKYYAENRDEVAAYKKKYDAENRDKLAAYKKKHYEENRGKFSARYKKHYEESRDKYLARVKKYRQKFPEKKAALAAKRRSAKLERIPSWSNEADLKAIKKIYARCKMITELTGVEHHVDHVIPMQGDNVSGLHHSTNLAIIPAAQNISKSNNWEFQEVQYGK